MDRWLIVSRDISIYVKNKKFTPSSYYRVMQYITFFKDKNIVVREAIPDYLYEDYINRNSQSLIINKIKNFSYFIYIVARIMYFLIADIINKPKNIIVSKALIPRYQIKPVLYLLKKLSKQTNLIWDFDDNILENKQISKKEFHLLEENSASIIVTSNILKELINPLFRGKVLILPTTDRTLKLGNLEEIIDRRKATFETTINIVWLATSGNLIHLQEVLKEIDHFAFVMSKSAGKQVVLKVICDKPLEETTEKLVVENIKWSRHIVDREFESSHIGIMPLIDNEFTRGKGGFKLIQYQLAGLPIIASDVGYNRSIYNGEVGILVKNKNEWTNALIKTTSSKKVWEKYSRNSIKNAKTNYSPENNLDFWMKIIK